MSKGHLDQPAYDAACRAAEWAAARGLRAQWSRIYFNADGSRTFHFTYEPLKPPRKSKATEAEPTAPAERQRVKRGGVPKPEQGALDL